MNYVELLGLVGGAGVVALVLRRFGLLPGRRSADPPSPLDRESSRSAAREREIQAHREREAADDRAHNEVNSRPVTDDPAADLADRLYGSDDDDAA